MTLEQTASNRCFEGEQLRFKHQSQTLGCEMVFSLYLPPQAKTQKVPLLYWLSGLTCTDENFVHKAGAQRYAAEHGIAILCPDTSPRGDDVPDDAEGAWDFGKGAGFYVNATQAPWSSHYRMYDYVTQELPEIAAGFDSLDSARCSISGHSMGGHGAMVIALRNPGTYTSVSAFSPIVAPTQCPWGEKALGNYLGEDHSEWANYDACALIAAGASQLPLLVDQGEADDFLEEQLRTELLEQTCSEQGYAATIRRQAGYDHSYYFVASFIGSHIAFHAQALAAE
ncbi:MAG: S-formylglutathione hydrolase [Halieaceae bacterium]|nr:S-formylglutathione hydrolase [Halieaceae bacterium]